MKDYIQLSQYERAKKKVKDIRAFYMNLMCYCIVIPALIYINLTFSPEFHWFWFSAAGWGVGVLVHGLSAFNFVPFLGYDWQERKIQELMEKDRQQHQKL